jgi:hypothetical protein
MEAVERGGFKPHEHMRYEAALAFYNPQCPFSLLIACQKGHAEAARMLLAAGARADLSATDGGEAITCVQVAQREGHMEVVALLEGASTKGSKHIEMSKVLLAEQAAEQAAKMELAAAEEKEKLAEVKTKLAEAEWDSDDEPESPLRSSEWDSDDEPESLSPAQFAIVQGTKQLSFCPARRLQQQHR